MDHGTRHSCIPDALPPIALFPASRKTPKQHAYTTGYQAPSPQFKAAVAKILAAVEPRS